MKSTEFILESAASELATKLPSLKKHDYNTIDRLMQKIAAKHDITGKALHDLFVKKYKNTPDHWIKNKLDETSFTSNDIKKPRLKRTGKDNNISEIREFYSRLTREYYGTPKINVVTEWTNNLLDTLNEDVNDELTSFYSQLKKISNSNVANIKVGSSICILQIIADIYSRTVICRGFKNPKTIVNVVHDDAGVKQIEFDDGTVFPDKYEFSTTELGNDLINTLMFNNSNELEKTLSYIALIKPDNFNVGTKLLKENTTHSNLQKEVEKFTNWASSKLNLQTQPKVVLSMDTVEARTNHHTGGHTVGDDKIWVYAKNRNLVDILRTVAHELTHVRQGELDMIKPGSSYPGSPIELLADMVAGKLIKIYGKQNRNIFQ